MASTSRPTSNKTVSSITQVLRQVLADDSDRGAGSDVARSDVEDSTDSSDGSSLSAQIQSQPGSQSSEDELVGNNDSESTTMVESCRNQCSGDLFVCSV